MWQLFYRKRYQSGVAGPRQWSLDTPLVNWSRRDAWTIGHAVQNTLCMGQTGSGKSSGSGRQIAAAFLKAGFGGLVLCAKPDEAQVWKAYCRDAGREQDLLVVGPGSRWRFNPFVFESVRRGPGAGQPSVFTRLRTGGPENGGLVDGILVQSGKVFRDTGKIWRPVTFRQQ
jgi:hypothetical protein